MTNDTNTNPITMNFEPAREALREYGLTLWRSAEYLVAVESLTQDDVIPTRATVAKRLHGSRKRTMDNARAAMNTLVRHDLVSVSIRDDGWNEYRVTELGSVACQKFREVVAQWAQNPNSVKPSNPLPDTNPSMKMGDVSLDIFAPSPLNAYEFPCVGKFMDEYGVRQWRTVRYLFAMKILDSENKTLTIPSIKAVMASAGVKVAPTLLMMENLVEAGIIRSIEGNPVIPRATQIYELTPRGIDACLEALEIEKLGRETLANRKRVCEEKERVLEEKQRIREEKQLVRENVREEKQRSREEKERAREEKQRVLEGKQRAREARRLVREEKERSREARRLVREEKERSREARQLELDENRRVREENRRVREEKERARLINVRQVESKKRLLENYGLKYWYQTKYLTAISILSEIGITPKTVVIADVCNVPRITESQLQPLIDNGLIVNTTTGKSRNNHFELTAKGVEACSEIGAIQEEEKLDDLN